MPRLTHTEYLTDTERLLAIVRPACACGAIAVNVFNGLAVCAKCHQAAQHHHRETDLEAELVADWMLGVRP